MLTGSHLRQACELLQWDRYEMQRRTALPLFVIDLLMRSPGDLNGTRADEIILKNAFHRAGVEFISDGPRLRVDPM